MSRCARCGYPRSKHHYGIPRYGPACGLFTPRDPWWIRTLAAIGRRKP